MVGPPGRWRPGRAVALAATALAAGGAPTPDGDPCLAAFVLQRSPLGVEELASAADGEIVLGTLSTEGPRQVGIVGMMRVDAPIHVVRDALAAVRPLIDGEYLTAFGLLGADAVGEDLAAYHMPESDVEALWSCVPGNCRVKITLELLRLLGALPWRGTTAPAGLDAAMRGWMASRVAEYARSGRDALVVFNDKQPPQPLDGGFRELLAASDVLTLDLPELRGYVADYPAVSLPGVTDRFSWSLQDFGMRPTTILTHTVVLDQPDRVPQSVVVGKQLYASHYLHAALTVIALVEDAEADRPATYLVVYDHYLFDDDVGMVRRLLATRRLRGYLGRRLEGLRGTVESAPLTVAAEVNATTPRGVQACPFVEGGD